MLILGVADNHDSGAAVVVDGHLRAAVGQERLDRTKNSGAFPWDAIDAALGVVGANPADVDRVVFGSAYTPATLLRLMPGTHAQAKGQGNFSYLLNLYVAYQVALRRAHLERLERVPSLGLMRHRLTRRGFRTRDVRLMDHHEAHAHTAYRSQARDPVLVITLDAMGDGLTATVWRGEGGRLHPLYGQSGLAAVNMFYSRITQFLGFRPNRHEGKITGLAAYTEPPAPLVAHMTRMLRFQEPGFNRLNVLRRQRPDDATWRALRPYSREQVAAAAQAVLERAVCDFVRHWVARSGIQHLALAGGTFANVKLNQRLAELPEVRSLFIYPNMGDGGLAAGAAMGSAELAPQRLAHAYLGPSWTDARIGQALAEAGLVASPHPDPVARVVALLDKGRVVARFSGAMEWGPRALGNRTILYRPDDPAVNDWLNERLRRTEFMPFAPITLAEDAPDMYLGLDKAADAARFMTVCFDCTPTMKRSCPGVVHVDGTARPQVLHRQDNPALHRLLTLFKQRTGLATLVNTSFNMHEEPIVCSPQDAIRAWKDARLDALLLGPYLLESPETAAIPT